MHVTKRRLGYNYVVAIGIVLSVLFLAQLRPSLPSSNVVWYLIGALPGLALISAGYWLPRTGFTADQVWTVAQACALGLGMIVLVIGGLLVSTRPAIGDPLLSVLLGGLLLVGAIGGLFVGVIWEFHNTNSRLVVRNEVLNRVLRHNLRNDMTVVQCHLESVKSQLSGSRQAEIETAQRKVEAFLGLAEKIRQVDISIQSGHRNRQPVDIVAIIESRVDTVRQVYPSVGVTVETPAEAWAYADSLFGTVLDNVIESAVVYSDHVPNIRVTVTVEDTWVTVSLIDEGHSLPESDFTIVDDGKETQLDHGQGIELWLVDWLVEGYGGEVAFDTTEAGNAIEIRLKRAGDRNSLIF